MRSDLDRAPELRLMNATGPWRRAVLAGPSAERRT